MKQPSYVGFDEKSYAWKADVEYRENPHLYRIGRGQQGVLTCEPYKSEIVVLAVPYSTTSAALDPKILDLFYEYLQKTISWGPTWPKSFFTWDTHDPDGMLIIDRERMDERTGNWEVLPQEPDAMTCEKAESAEIFKEA